MLVKQLNYYAEHRLTITVDGRDVIVYITPAMFEKRRLVTLALEADRDIKFSFEENLRFMDSYGNEQGEK